MIFARNDIKILSTAINEAYRADENHCVNALIQNATLPPSTLEEIKNTAEKLVKGTRAFRKKKLSIDTFLNEYDLSSAEGIALMCLAEALLRTPDTYTANRLISDKISTAQWSAHTSDTLLVNIASKLLSLTGKIYAPLLEQPRSFKKTLASSSAALIRPIIQQGMKMIGNHFVMGTTIETALKRAKKQEAKGYRYSYDMLGEAAKTAEDAEKYFQSYLDAVQAIGKSAKNIDPLKSPGISVKLSALHPRYELAKRERVLTELPPKLLAIAKAAKSYNIGLTVDAEEADRLELSLEIIEKVFSDSSLQNWEGFGLAVQAYQKRAPFVLDWLADLSKQYQRRLMVRLVKGAYWDSEIKMSQVLGLEGYPVFTRKNSTDVSYLACAKKLLSQPECFYPQFGTHNAYSVAAILAMAKKDSEFEFQCLHGMGESLYDQIIAQYPTRIYAPVGSHQDLLGYLVRRLLENGANTSFIHLLADDNTPIDNIIADPVKRIAALPHKPHPHIPLPKDIFGNERLNSTGMDLSNMQTLAQLKKSMEAVEKEPWIAGPIINGKMLTHSKPIPVHCPSNTDRIVGHVHETTAEEVTAAIAVATKSKSKWEHTSIEERAQCLERAADLFEKNMSRLMTILCREGGKQLTDCVSEVREAIDFCRYYAAEARTELSPKTLKGPTGEFNELSLHPRGLITCISPWNFPMAIFTGQIVAALVCGNTVIAKPAEQTPIIAAEITRLLHEAGIPKGVLQLLTGRGEIVGAQLVADPRVVGVIFTGSTETAKLIQKSLTEREGPIPFFIAETGGQNTMIVDSSALPEQVVTDVISSAFNSAGQRCSALRVLFVQDDIAPRLLEMLKGAMAELMVGDPGLISTDVGPVIDKDALSNLEKHAKRMNEEASLLYEVPLKTETKGHFFAPRAYELKDLSVLKREVFGPVLHVIRYAAKDLDRILDQIIQTGYGLTLGIHSRIGATVKYIQSRMPIGNVYVNRNMIGAVVGVQPFGGEGLSGTGPKAGGPHYLPRLCVERAISINTTAAGGNTSLVSMQEE